MEGLERPLVTCEAVIAESCYLLRGLPGAPETVLENVELGVFQIAFQLSRLAIPVQSIMRKYRDLPLGFADACLIQLADELNTGDILTLDRDFESYRWRRTCLRLSREPQTRCSGRYTYSGCVPASVCGLLILRLHPEDISDDFGGVS